MVNTAPIITNHNVFLYPDPGRIILRPFRPKNDSQFINIISRIMALPEESVLSLLNSVLNDFSANHENIEPVFLKHYELAEPYLPDNGQQLSGQRKLLIGSYFTSEYTFESAALFNPSIVRHPDQSRLPKGSLRFIMSLRATGEGHISSLTFRTGVIDERNTFVIDKPRKYAFTATRLPDAIYDKQTFHLKLSEMGVENGFSSQVLSLLKDTFTFTELTDILKNVLANSNIEDQAVYLSNDKIQWLALSNYETELPSSGRISDFVIFPASPAEQNGIEDARFVLFKDDDGNDTYYATYTAYDGKAILPQLLETKDFRHFKMITLNGKAVENKGIALFPRKINGKYAMISRQDNENLFIMYSDNIHFWQEASLIMKPLYDWEFVQVGNCGSPIETDSGWIVITHGVGPCRRYCISAILLDRNDPSQVIGRLKKPLIVPGAIEHSGYVPNVVYTCGALIHNQTLILPYAISDCSTTVALINLKTLLKSLT